MTLIDEIIDSLNNTPDDWTWNGYYLIHNVFNIRIWVGSTGSAYLDISKNDGGNKVDLGFFDRRRLWSAIKPVVKKFRDDIKLKTMADFGLRK